MLTGENRTSAVRMLGDAEKTLCFFDADRIADELQSEAAVAFF